MAERGRHIEQLCEEIALTDLRIIEEKVVPDVENDDSKRRRAANGVEVNRRISRRQGRRWRTDAAAEAVGIASLDQQRVTRMKPTCAR